MPLKYTKRQYSILIFILIVYTMNGIGVFSQSLFYPKIAEEKGIDALYYSSVFSSYYLSWFLASSLSRLLVTLVNPYVVAKAGTFLIGVTNILFGNLNKINDSSIFLSFSYIIRIVEAFGLASFAVSAFCIAAKEFPNDTGVIIGVFETGHGLGLGLSCFVGATSYFLGGFAAPFTTVGLFTVSVGIIAIFLKGSENDILISVKYKNVFTLLKNWEFLLALCSEFLVTFTFGVFSSTMEPHSRILKLSPSVNTLLFSLFGTSYFISSLPWGKLCDLGKSPKKLWCIGAFLTCIASMCLGPAPYFKISLNITLFCTGLIIFGIGGSGIVVSSFSCFYKVALKIGYSDDIRTYSLVSSIFNSVYSIGGLSGSMVGGLFSETIGIAWGLQIAMAFYVLLIAVTLLYEFTRKKNDFPD